MGIVLQDLTQAQALIAELEAKLARARTRKLSIKVSEKGGVSVYGLGRFPVSLYRGQWERLLDAADEIRQFLIDNADSLSVKE